MDASRTSDRRAQETLPGGVSHNIRAVDPHPRYIERAEGPYVWDVDGNRYVDFWMNHLVSVLGHAHPAVVAAVREQAGRGFHYGAVNEPALELAERVADYVPSAERLRYYASGTEATIHDDDAVARAEAAGLRVVQDRCMKPEHGRLIASTWASVHWSISGTA